MTDLSTTLNNIGLNPEQQKEIASWIASKSLNTKVPAEKITELFITRTEEAVAAQINTEMEFVEQFIEYLKSVTLADTSEIIPPPPGVPVEVLPIGYYPFKNMKHGAGHQKVSTIMGWGKRKDGNLTTLEMTAFGDDAIAKRNLITPFNIYDTVGSMNPEKKGAGPIKCSVHEDTNFDGNTITPSYLPVEIAERVRIVLSNYPVVALSDAKNNLSKLLQAEKNGKKTSSYVDQTDLKIIQVTIQDFQSGWGADAVREWGRYEVSDSTFTPSSSRKGMTVWVDPILARKIGAGKGSFVKIIGTLQKDSKGQYEEMSACGIVPIGILKPLIESAPDMSGKNSPVGNVSASESKVLNISL